MTERPVFPKPRAGAARNLAMATFGALAVGALIWTPQIPWGTPAVPTEFVPMKFP